MLGGRCERNIDATNTAAYIRARKAIQQRLTESSSCMLEFGRRLKQVGCLEEVTQLGGHMREAEHPYVPVQCALQVQIRTARREVADCEARYLTKGINQFAPASNRVLPMSIRVFRQVLFRINLRRSGGL